jgi:hypothetical protein
MMTMVALLLMPAPSAAGPWVEVGNSQLRSDIQVLADGGIITGAITTWPLAWTDIAASLESPGKDLTDYQRAALRRVRTEARKQMRTGSVDAHARVAWANDPIQFRSFEDTPREDGEVELGLTWTGDWAAIKLQGSWVDDPQDGKKWRADGSYLAFSLGNWMIAASTMDRWWGSGWQSSMIMSSNARPIPSISIGRNSTQAFETKWLSWIGPWDAYVFWGQMESDRFVPDANIYGMRVNFRPITSLEVGLSRTAQLCGEGRKCDFDTIMDSILGNDNRGDNVSAEDEPGNQLGGWDVRWSNDSFRQPFALYTQWVGEDEGGGLPAKYAAQFGTETWGQWESLGTYRFYLEWADTTCNFQAYKGSDKKVPNCAYNNGTYRTGFRYRDRPVASTFDNDSSVFTFGTMLTDNQDHIWQMKLGYGNLNRYGNPDKRNAVARTKKRYREIQLNHQREVGPINVKLGTGYLYLKNVNSGNTDEDFNVFVELTYDTY